MRVEKGNREEEKRARLLQQAAARFQLDGDASCARFGSLSELIK